MPVWLGVTIAIGCYALGCGFGLLITILGVVSREKKSVRDGIIEIDGEEYILGKIIKKGEVRNEKS